MGLQSRETKLMEVFKNLKTLFDVFTGALDRYALPLTSQYRILEFGGLADGITDLAPNFLPADVAGRTLVIKAIRIKSFYSEVAGNVDFSITDGVSTFNETIPTLHSIERLFEFFGASPYLQIFINGSTVPIVQDPNANLIGNIPLDLNVDNIFYRYPEKIESFNVRLNAVILHNIPLGLQSNPQVKIWFECYLI